MLEVRKNGETGLPTALRQDDSHDRLLSVHVHRQRTFKTDHSQKQQKLNARTAVLNKKNQVIKD